jgi:hypothetical protein
MIPQRTTRLHRFERSLGALSALAREPSQKNRPDDYSPPGQKFSIRSWRIEDACRKKEKPGCVSATRLNRFDSTPAH